ncbi:TVP38/TMEM64 family protein, partial [Corynebacterium sanguinis]|nr:TVP38/TMEM64 family protein [Corynebacterium sanguinis]
MSRSRIALIAVAAALFIASWMLLDVPPLAVLRTWADQTGAWFPILFWVL